MIRAREGKELTENEIRGDQSKRKTLEAEENVKIDQERVEATELYGFANGLMIKAAKGSPQAIVAPHTIRPMYIKRDTFERAKELAPLFNLLTDAAARDHEFITKYIEPVAAADPFTGRLYEIYKKVYNEGKMQEYNVGIHRSDYMFHGEEQIPQQVELNTISAGFGALSTKMNQLHQQTMAKYENFDEKQIKVSKGEIKVPNVMIEAHKAHKTNNTALKKIVIFLVQPEERNFADQTFLQQGVEKEGIAVKRMTMNQIIKEATIEGDDLIITHRGEKKIISLVYYRAAYTPDDYPTEEEWEARYMIERSSAIKCPPIAYQLIGTKYMQQVFTRKGMVEKFMNQEDSKKIRSVFTGIHSLYDETFVKKAIERPELYVVKPQREGGGHLVYGEKLVELLKKIPENPSLKDAYILMERIIPVPELATIYRLGKTTSTNCVSEFGTYCTFLGNGKDKPIVNEYAGYLLRTKEADKEDGGVASGVASFNSAVLKD